MVAGSPGLLRAARDKLMARERGKGEVRTKREPKQININKFLGIKKPLGQT